MQLELGREFNEDYMKVGKKHGVYWVAGVLTRLCVLLSAVAPSSGIIFGISKVC